VCHSDLQLMHDCLPRWYRSWLAGIFYSPWGMAISTPVVISPVWGCGKCRSCRSGADNYCDHPNPAGSGGPGRNGGLAEYMVVPVSAMVPLNSLEPADTALLTDTGLTSYHAVKRCLPLLTPDTAAVVIGVGGRGHLAVEFLSVFL
jgi:propanol-preferring alcohol dehydrogenase